MNMKDTQKAVWQNKVDKGFNTTDVNMEFCLLYGEVGEAHETWRNKWPGVGEELADVAIYLMGLAEMLGIDLEDEIEKKVAINRAREYRSVNGVMLKAEKTKKPEK